MTQPTRIPPPFPEDAVPMTVIQEDVPQVEEEPSEPVFDLEYVNQYILDYKKDIYDFLSTQLVQIHRDFELDEEKQELSFALLTMFQNASNDATLELCESFGTALPDSYPQEEDEEEDLPPLQEYAHVHLEQPATLTGYRESSYPSEEELRSLPPYPRSAIPSRGSDYYRRNCNNCRRSINDRPSNHTLCLNCYRR